MQKINSTKYELIIHTPEVDSGTCISWQNHCHQMGKTVGGVVVNDKLWSPKSSRFESHKEQTMRYQHCATEQRHLTLGCPSGTTPDMNAATASCLGYNNLLN